MTETVYITKKFKTALEQINEQIENNQAEMGKHRWTSEKYKELLNEAIKLEKQKGELLKFEYEKTGGKL